MRKNMRETGEILPDEQIKILGEAIAIKLEQLHATDNTKSDDEHVVKLMADLQDQQDKEANNVMKDLDQKVNDFSVKIFGYRRKKSNINFIQYLGAGI